MSYSVYTTWPTVLKKFKKEFSQCWLYLSLQCEIYKLKLVMIRLSLRTCSCKLYETWCNLMVNFGKLKQILHQSLTKRVLTLKKIYTLWYKVQWEAFERVYKVTLLHPLFTVKSDKNINTNNIPWMGILTCDTLYQEAKNTKN